MELEDWNEHPYEGQRAQCHDVGMVLLGEDLNIHVRHPQPTSQDLGLGLIRVPCGLGPPGDQPHLLVVPA